MSLFKKKPAGFILSLGFGLFLTSGVAGTLTACGYKPLYGEYSDNAERKSAAEKLGQIQIAIIPDREGQILRNLLIDSFHANDRAGNFLYTLEVRPVKQNIIEFDITEESDTTRAQLKLSTRLSLKNRENGERLLNRELRSFVSYNILDNQHATRVSRQTALENGIRDLARQIETQVALYFRQDH